MNPVRLGALDGLQRGILSLRANWELIPLACLQTILLVALGFASLLPFYLVLDIDLPASDLSPEEGSAWLLETLTAVYAETASPAFWLAVLSSSAVGLALLACYCFFQAGVFGVFATADRQAPPGRPTQAAWFRTYSWAEFQGRGGMHLWRFFWLFNLVMLFWIGLVVLATLALLASGLIASGAGLPAGLAFGCASILPILFLSLLLFFWALFGQALIADSDCGAWQGLRIGLRLLVRRLGAVALLFVVMVLASLTMAMLFLVLSLPLNSGLMPIGGLAFAAMIGLQLLQWLASAVIQLAVVGAVVAIARSESELEGRAHVQVSG